MLTYKIRAWFSVVSLRNSRTVMEPKEESDETEKLFKNAKNDIIEGLRVRIYRT